MQKREFPAFFPSEDVVSAPEESSSQKDIDHYEAQNKLYETVAGVRVSAMKPSRQCDPCATPPHACYPVTRGPLCVPCATPIHAFHAVTRGPLCRCVISSGVARPSAPSPHSVVRAVIEHDLIYV